MPERTGEARPASEVPGERRFGAIALTACLGVLAVILGLWGHGRVSDLSATDSAYRTVQLFYVNSPIPDQGVPWQLEVARFLAPAVLLWAVVATVLALTRERIRRWFLAHWGAGHLLVVGLGERGRRLARAARTADRRGEPLDFGEFGPSGGGRRHARHPLQTRVLGNTVALDREGDAAESLRRTGLTVLEGDATDPETLRRCAAHRARAVALLAGDDTANLEILAALRRVFGGRIGTRVHIAVEDPAVWAELHRVPLDPDAARSEVRFISIPDRSARLLVEAARDGSAARPANQPERIVIWGEGPTVFHTAVRVVRAGLAGNQRPELVLCGADAERNLERLDALEPWLRKRASPVLGTEPASWKDADLAFVCAAGEAGTLSAIATLRRWVAVDAPIYAAIPDDDVADALRAAGAQPGRTELISIADSLYDGTWLTAWDLTELARARHELYLRSELAAGKRLGDAPALVPWLELSDELRAANEDFAAGAARLLRELGAELAPLVGRETGDLPLGDEEIHRLAVGEHDRWVADKLARGWKHGPERSDDEKLHPNIVPWEELDDSDRAKDYDSVRGLAEMLAATGHELVMTERDDAAAADRTAAGRGTAT